MNSEDANALIAVLAEEAADKDTALDFRLVDILAKRLGEKKPERMLAVVKDAPIIPEPVIKEVIKEIKSDVVVKELPSWLWPILAALGVAQLIDIGMPWLLLLV